MQKRVLIVAVAVVACIIGAAGYLLTRPDAPYLSPAMLNASGADIGGPFTLTNHKGEKVTEAEVIDRPALVYFGYTYCPDICPIDVQIMADAVQLLEDKNIEVRPVFVTIDPGRDTAEVLSEYVDIMHPRMWGLTGTEEEVRVAADAYKVFYQRMNVPGSAAEYLMQHTGYTYLMTPQKGVTAVFRRDFPPEQIAADIEAVLAQLN